MYQAEKSVLSGFGIVILIFMIVNSIIGAFLWPYSIETIGAMMGNTDVHVAWWQGSLIGFVPYVGNITIPVAFIVFILSLILL